MMVTGVKCYFEVYGIFRSENYGNAYYVWEIAWNPTNIWSNFDNFSGHALVQILDSLLYKIVHAALNIV